KEQLVLWMAHAWIWLRDNLPGIAAGVFNWFRDLPGKIVETIGNVGTFLFNKGKDLIGGLLNGIGSAFTGLKDLAGGAFNWIAKIWNNTVGKLSFTVPDIIGVPGRGQTYSMPKLPTYSSFHTGGVVPGRATDESTAVLLGQETVFTRDQTRALGLALRTGSTATTGTAGGAGGNGMMAPVVEAAEKGGVDASRALSTGLANFAPTTKMAAVTAAADLAVGLAPMAPTAAVAADEVSLAFAGSMESIRSTATDKSAEAAWLFAANMNLVRDRARDSSAEALFYFAANLNAMAEAAQQSTFSASPAVGSSPGSAASAATGATSQGSTTGSAAPSYFWRGYPFKLPTESEAAWSVRVPHQVRVGTLIRGTGPQRWMGNPHRNPGETEYAWTSRVPHDIRVALLSGWKYHTGDVIQGTGEKQVTVQGGEGVFTKRQMAALAPVEQRITRKQAPAITRGALEELRRIVNRASPEAPASRAQTGGEGDEMRTVKHIIELVVSGDKATLSKLDRRELMAMLREVFRTAEGRRVAAEAMANAG
ncbi:MAG: hypothetical protein WAS75_07930, partial [Candidatus Microthrix subdominans]